jgi:phage anti-repressor protein
MNLTKRTRTEFLVKIEERRIDKKLIPTINARDLWSKLRSKQHFSDWIKNRIDKYDFVKGVDYGIN